MRERLAKERARQSEGAFSTRLDWARATMRARRAPSSTPKRTLLLSRRKLSQRRSKIDRIYWSRRAVCAAHCRSRHALLRALVAVCCVIARCCLHIQRSSNTSQKERFSQKSLVEGLWRMLYTVQLLALTPTCNTTCRDHVLTSRRTRSAPRLIPRHLITKTHSAINYLAFAGEKKSQSLLQGSETL